MMETAGKCGKCWAAEGPELLLLLWTQKPYQCHVLQPRGVLRHQSCACRWAAGHRHCLHALHTLGASLPFLSSVLSSLSKEGVTFDEVPALQMSKTLPWYNKPLTGTDRSLFLLSCCLWPPQVCLLCFCVCGEGHGLCTHTALVQQPSLTRQLQLHPL